MISAFASIARFELRHHLRSWLFWAGALLLAFLAVRVIVTDVADFQLGAVLRNAPRQIMGGLIFSTFLGLFVSTAFVAGAVLRDRMLRVHELFFSTPISRGEYLGGRFLGAFLAAVLIFVPAAAAMMVGSLMPGLDPERVGPFMLAPYVSAFALFVIPTMFVLSAVFFGLATLTRSMVWTYVGVVGLFLAYFVAGEVADARLSALLDPFAYRAFAFEIRFWTVEEMNTRVPGPEGLIFWNRLLWVGVGVAALALTRAAFRPEAVVTGGARERDDGTGLLRRWTLRGARDSRKKLPEAPAAETRGRLRASGRQALPAVEATGGARSDLARLRSRTKLELSRVLRSAPFYVILSLAVLALVWSFQFLGAGPGGGQTLVHPTTGQIVELVDGMFWFFLVIILVFYAGEMVWRDREVGVAEALDATSTPGWVFWSAKLLALVAIVFVVLLVAVGTGMGFQLARGHPSLEADLYLRAIFLGSGVAYVQIAALALLVQVLVNHKYAGFGVMALFILSPMILDQLGLHHRLYRFAEAPEVAYSDMNGYGHHAAPLIWLSVYWTFAAAALTVVIHLLWVRGRETGIRRRLLRMRTRLTGKARGVLAVSLAGFVLTGGWIFYNTNILNESIPPAEVRDWQAQYESAYKPFENVPQPRITKVYTEVDIYPERRRVTIRGRYNLTNRADVPIDSLHVRIPGPHGVMRSDVEVRRLQLAGSVIREDELTGYRIYELDESLPPGEDMELVFDLAVQARGFVTHGSDQRLVANGTSFDQHDYFPHIGYNRRLELQDPIERRKRGLPPLQRMPALEDESARSNHYMSSQADWIEFEAVVSTSVDQMALAPGALLEEWTADGRRYFHYRTEAPVLAFWAFLSAGWEVVRHRWNDEVDVVVYHHPAHHYNVERILEAATHALEYKTEHFSPYPHRELRIAQVHRLEGRAFPGLIAVSEEAGFIASADDPEAMYALHHGYVHEVAHQWWPHQVVGADLQGATLMSESLAEYLALVITAERYGLPYLSRALRRELESYLAGRGRERYQERPLLRVENQGYIHYGKGSLVLFRLRELFGEERLNRALANYLDRTAFQDPPYTTSLEFLEAIRDAVPEDMALEQADRLVEDLFETITLWDLRAAEATAAPREDGRWDVRLEVEAAKLRADGEGGGTEIPMDDLVEVGVFGAAEEGAPPQGRILHLELVRLRDGATSLEFVVDEEPRRAGVDPLHRLINRSPGDNVVPVRRHAPIGGVRDAQPY